MGLAKLTILLTALQALFASADKQQIKTLVTFGDSYTDLSLSSFPLWPAYAAGYGNFEIMDFARAGATCSNALTPRIWPGVMEDELPAYLNATKNGKTLKSQETIYTLWIGTNDLGVGELITGQANPGVSIVNTTSCAVSWVQKLYDTGARNFFFQNMVPLERVPLYSSNSYPNRYWSETRNTTEWSVFMRELVLAGNALAELMLQKLARDLHGASVCLFDSHGLFTDILDHPALYLNGTLPLNTTGAAQACVFTLNESLSDTGNCVIHQGAEADSFVWFDELHPSEQSQRVVAREIVAAIDGKKRWLRCF